jgi:TM2 domain-containing membrane protein YozV
MEGGGGLQLLRGYSMSDGRGSTGNVVAGIASFFIPGLGQLVQGRVFAAIFMFVLAGAIHLLSFGLLGWLGHVIAAVHAAVYDPE